MGISANSAMAIGWDRSRPALLNLVRVDGLFPPTIGIFAPAEVEIQRARIIKVLNEEESGATLVEVQDVKSR